jgi:DNA-binding response OmpR family regulator
MKILIAHEDPATRDLIVSAAPDDGKLVVATDGIRAWEMLNEKDPPRIAVLGWVLPNINALEICRRIRKRASSAYYTYVMVLAARPERSDMSVAFQSGADDYIAKPLEKDEIAGRLQTGLRMLRNEEVLSSIVQGWRTMLDSLPFGVACLGPEGQLRRANKLFVELLGYRVSGFAGTSQNWRLVRESVHLARLLPDPAQRAQLIEALRLGKSFDHRRLDMIQEDGNPRSLLVWGRPVPNIPDIAFQVVVSEP